MRAVLWYFLVFGIFVVSYVWDISLPGIEWWVLLPGILLCKDILLFFGEIPAIKESVLDWGRVEKQFQKWKLPRWYKLALVNRRYLFPTFLTLYMLYLLVKQTHIRDLYLSIWFLALDEQLLLFLTVISGIATIFGEQYDQQFEQTKISQTKAYGYIALSFVLSVLWGYIVLQQVLKLGVLGIIIANIVIVLIFLVGMSLLDEEEK